MRKGWFFNHNLQFQPTFDCPGRCCLQLKPGKTGIGVYLLKMFDAIYNLKSSSNLPESFILYYQQLADIQGITWLSSSSHNIATIK